MEEFVEETTTAGAPAPTTRAPVEDFIEETTTAMPPATVEAAAVPGTLVATTVTVLEQTDVSLPNGDVPEGTPPADTVKVIDIRIDLDGLLIGDMKILGRATSGNLPMEELVDFLDRVVVGGVSHLAMRHLTAIIEKLGDAISESTNPGN